MKIEAFGDRLKRWPLVAILRGIKPAEALEFGAMESIAEERDGGKTAADAAAGRLRLRVVEEG